MTDKTSLPNGILEHVEQAERALPMPAADLELATKLVPYEERHFKTAGLAEQLGYRDATPYYRADTVKVHARELAIAALIEVGASGALAQLQLSQAVTGKPVLQDIRQEAQTAGLLGVPYCLWCSKEGHLTTDCHSTHSLNNPRALELSRLARLAHECLRSEGNQPQDAGAIL